MAHELLVLQENLQNIHQPACGANLTHVKLAAGPRPNHGHMTERSKVIRSTAKYLDDKHLITTIKRATGTPPVLQEILLPERNSPLEKQDSCNM